MAEDPDDAADEAVDAARAFAALRAEVAGLRRALEALPGALEVNRPPDTAPTLGGIVKGLAEVAGRLEAIERHPALWLTPEQHRQALARASEGLAREAAREIEWAAQGLAHERRQLADLVGGARQRGEQRTWLAGTALAAVVVGLLLSPVLASLLPFGLNGRVAALVMRENRWNAGAELMAAANPATWDELVVASQLARANDAKLGGCREAASKAGKDQRCTITVPAP